MSFGSIRATTIRADALRTLRVGLPLIGAQLLQMSNGLVDSIVAGRIGRAELAAGGVGASLWFVTALLCIGFMAGLSPTLSRLIGKRDSMSVGRVFRQGIWLALCVGCLAMTLLFYLRLQLDHFQLADELPDLISDYILGAAASLPFLALVMAARNVLEATGVTRPVLIVMALGLLINGTSSAVLGLGLFGFPALGLFGIGLSTSVVNLCMAILLFLILTKSRFRRYSLFTSVEMPQLSILRPMLALSLPIFLGMLFESGLFVATSLQMGMLGLIESGAHQIAITASAFCYMLPLGLSFALTARVARAEAAGGVVSVRLRIVSAAVLIAVMALITATVLVVFRQQIAAVYTDDPIVRNFAASLLLYGAFFQLSDGAQITLIGILRGLHDTRVPMIINAFSYWVVALGLGLFAAHIVGLGAHGLWIGLIAGLSVASVLLGIRLNWKLKNLSADQPQST
ncbi:MAG: MATE family efflux transporter [Granulosicoccus sp.]|nr:MATE family efflux transporter [Granulosicoccus sp.]